MTVDEAQRLRMYIVVREAIDIGHAMLAVGHGVLAAYRDVSARVDHPYNRLMMDWVTCSFRKCAVSATDDQFKRLKETMDVNSVLVMTESGLGGAETALVCFPREDHKWPKLLKFLPLYGKGKVLVDAPTA